MSNVVINPYVFSSSKEKIEWDSPLNNAIQSDGILTKNAGGNSWTNCCNFSGDTETYAIGTNAYEFHYTGDVTGTEYVAAVNVQNIVNIVELEKQKK